MEKHRKRKDERTEDGQKEGEAGLDLRDNGTLETDKVVCWKKERAVLGWSGLVCFGGFAQKARNKGG